MSVKYTLSCPRFHFVQFWNQLLFLSPSFSLHIYIVYMYTYTYKDASLNIFSLRYSCGVSYRKKKKKRSYHLEDAPQVLGLQTLPQVILADSYF